MKKFSRRLFSEGFLYGGLKLVLVSLLVGVVLHRREWTPKTVFLHIFLLLRSFFGSIFSSFHAVAEYIVNGALVVIPVFCIIFLLRWLSYRSR